MIGALVRMEFDKARRTPLAWVPFVILTGLAVASAVTSVFSYESFTATLLKYIEDSYKSPFVGSVFNYWLPGGTVALSIPNLFFFLAPLLVALGYSWSVRRELESGYAQHVLLRCTRGQYYAAKYVATFVIGGLVITVPLLVDLAILVCFVPAYPLEMADSIYIGIFESTAFSSLLFCHPWAYVALRLVLDFALCGAWAVLVLGISLFVRNRVALLVGPYLGLYIVKYVSEKLYSFGWFDFNSALTVLDQTRARGDGYDYLPWVLFTDIAVMLVVSLVLPLIAKKRDVL